MTRLVLLSSLVVGLWFAGCCSAFVAPSVFSNKMTAASSTLLRDAERDPATTAAPLPLTASDLQRLSSLRARHVTMPLMIMEAILPGQTISFESSDPKFHKLITYVLNNNDSNSNEIGMIGFNPHTGRPLNVGVTMAIYPEDVVHNPRTNALTVTVRGDRQFEVQGEPWLYNNKKNAFYMASVEIVNDRPEEPLADDQAHQGQLLADSIPGLVEEWVKNVFQHSEDGEADPDTVARVHAQLSELGPLPSDWKARAYWVASLLNPAAADQSPVCLEIRPAMLSCHNDYNRIMLAVAGLQSSINHLSGQQKLFE